MSYMWYTKQLLFCPYPCSGLIEMLYSSNPPLAPLLLDLSSDNGSLPVVRLPADPFLEFGNVVVLMDISSAVRVSSQINAYVEC